MRRIAQVVAEAGSIVFSDGIFNFILEGFKHARIAKKLVHICKQ